MVEWHSPSKSKSGLPAIDLISVAQGLVVAESLSFRRAARVLGTQQSTVGRRVRALEDRLGVSLFERNSAGVRLTTAGARFFEQARVGLQQIDDAVQTAGAAGRGVIGELKIGILSSMAAGFLREVVRAYRAQHSDVELHVLEGARASRLRSFVRADWMSPSFWGFRACRIVRSLSFGANKYLWRSLKGTCSAIAMRSHGSLFVTKG